MTAKLEVLFWWAISSDELGGCHNERIEQDQRGSKAGLISTVQET
jgi:hypothetical protein